MKNIFVFWQWLCSFFKSNIRVITDINLGNTKKFILIPTELIPTKEHSTFGAYDYAAGGYLIVSDAQERLWVGFLTLENQQMLDDAGFAFDYEINADRFFSKEPEESEEPDSAQLILADILSSKQWRDLRSKENEKILLVTKFLKEHCDNMRHIYKEPRKFKLIASQVFLI